MEDREWGEKAGDGMMCPRRYAIEFRPGQPRWIRSRAVRILFAIAHVAVLAVLLFLSLTFVVIGLPLLFLFLVIYMAVLNVRRNRLIKKMRRQGGRQEEETRGEGPEVTLSDSDYRVLDDDEEEKEG